MNEHTAMTRRAKHTANLLKQDDQLSCRRLPAVRWCQTTAWVVLFSLAGVVSGHADPSLPILNTNLIFDVTNTAFAGGALGNGISNSAAAIQAAINMASTQIVGGVTGATVRVPAVGTLTNYLSGPINLASHVNLLIDTNAQLQMLPYGTWPSTTTFINGATLTDVEITGSGTIDGQGTNWWIAYHSSGISRPNFVEFDHCNRILIQGVTLRNPPTFHIYVKNSDNDLTVQNITIKTPGDSPNTDGMDISSTNVLIRNNYISDGDDDLEIGGNGAAANNITVSNCTFGTGHGVSIGSDTEGGVSNLVVSNCFWVGTEYGIKGKSDTDRGGTMQNLVYKDLYMTNVNFAIAFYSYYNTIESPTSSFTITPSEAATITDTGSDIPVWRNITVSNLTATGIGGNVASFFWGLPQSPITNFTLCQVNINAPTKTFCMYNVRGIQILDSNLTAPNSSTNTLTLYNAQFTVTNSAANANTVTMTGLWAPSNTVMSLFNGLAETADSGAFGANPVLTLANSMLTVSNSMSLGGSSTLNYGLGTNTTETVVTGNLTLGGTLNVADGGGFTNGTYTLFTYGGALTYGGLTVGTKPNTNFTYTVSTNTAGQVNLVVGSSGCSVGAAGSISGPSTVASGTNGVTYSISSVSGATVYTWTVPSGASVASGQGTTSITVNYSCSATSSNVTVTPSSGSCTGTAGSLAITVTGVGSAGSISGPTTVCAGQTGAGYSISGVSGATTYTWAVPSGATIASGQGGASISVNWGSTAGSVTVTPSNANGCTGSGSGVSVTVNAAPGILSGPLPQTVCAGGSASFTVSASGAGLSYQWQKNGVNISDGGTISGSATNMLTLTDVSTGDSGASFDCVVSGTCSPPAMSSGATLMVNASPATFNVTGGGSYCAAGGGVTVGLDGSESTASYQLELNGNATGVPVVGTGSAISFTNQMGIGTYTILASNMTSGCTATMNGSASVTAGDPFTCWQLQYFGCTNCPQAAATADPDGDGQNNMAEFLAGTDPTNSASVLTITSVIESGADVHVTWKTAGGHTNTVQVTSGDGNGGYNTNSFVDLPASQTILPGSGDTSTNYVDSGGATNVPSRYYRVRLVP